MPPKKSSLKESKESKEAKEPSKEPSKESSSSRESSKASTTHSCCVCCQRICTSKDEVLFCVGACQQWMHRYCASVSANAYRSLRESGTPFYCFSCYQVQSQGKVATLMTTVQQLREEIAGLKKTISFMHTIDQAPLQVVTEALKSSYAEVVSHGGESNSEGRVDGFSVGLNAQASSSRKLLANTDRKYNVVIYGISECPKGTSRSERLTQDLSKVESVFSHVSSSIQSQAIKDCYRLGKFNPQKPNPRPILVKLVRIADVQCILSNRKVLSSPFNVKPDMTVEERVRESILLKERWNLIQSGIPKNVIKIQGSRLYVRSALYGQFKDSKFVPSSTSLASHEHSSSNQSQSVSNSCTTPISTPSSNVSNPNSNVQLSSPPSIVPTHTPSTSHAPRNLSCNLQDSEAQPSSLSTFVPSKCNQTCESTSARRSDTNLSTQRD